MEERGEKNREGKREGGGAGKRGSENCDKVFKGKATGRDQNMESWERGRIVVFYDAKLLILQKFDTFSQGRACSCALKFGGGEEIVVFHNTKLLILQKFNIFDDSYVLFTCQRIENVVKL